MEATVGLGEDKMQPPGFVTQLLTAIGCAAAAASVARCEEPSSAEPVPLVVTIYDEQICAHMMSLEGKDLLLATEPPRQIALDEIERIELSSSAAASQLRAKWLGQDGNDGVENGGVGVSNGVQDAHVRLAGLPAGKKIREVWVERRVPAGHRWRWDDLEASDWRLHISHKAATGEADLYFEPTPEDLFERTLYVTVTYGEYGGGDEQTVEVKVSTHTDHQLAVGSPGNVVPSEIGPKGVTVWLVGGDQLRGEVLGMTDELLALRTSWGQDIEIPLSHAVGFWWGALTTDESRQSFERILNAPPKSDTALVVSNMQIATQVAGSVLGIAEGRLQFEYQGTTRSLNLSRLVGIVFAARRAERLSGSAHQIVHMTDGQRLTGRLSAISADSLSLVTRYEIPVSPPRNAVSWIEFRNGMMVYLSDLDPVDAEETPYFDRVIPYQRDRSLTGQPLRIRGVQYAHGIAVHSRTMLVYALNGEYERFKAILGFDESAPGHGRVSIRVLADGAELFREPDLDSNDNPAELDLSLGGANELTLEVDFGHNEDIGDRVIWASPRLYRGKPLPNP